ncbi:beta-lactamase family protein [Hymenobacter sp. BT188]|uniref:serine hydrolase domain-containing protein n=1 Tax=Hymenobacter sp. BT188 TaxID=2763504 RepID=UPI00165128B9|nr:serine hydrolase domain-containing protein [Hymenobacter sp. BT188]MBC6606720.1 beta-lactamase family protein [Hymenobacter sp. BT188]
MRIRTQALKPLVAFGLLLLLPLISQAQKATIQRLDGSRISVQKIEQLVLALMDSAKVPGLALAILEDNKVRYVKTFGYRNVQKRLPLEPQTAMYAASFSKAVFAYLVMQLVQEGALDLDKPLYQYLDKPLPEIKDYQDLATDERWKQITARMALTHTTGLPNWRWIEPDEKLRFRFAPGAQYWYSGEGLQLLQIVVEKITRKGLLQLGEERVFKPLGMTRTSYIWQPTFEQNYAIGYMEDGKAVPKEKRDEAQAAGSMETTITDYATFMAAVMQGKGLTPKAKQEMVRAQVAIPFKAQFGPLATVSTDENKAIKLAYGLGWGVFESPYGPAYFKEGHDDGWENHSVAFSDQKKGLVIMSNSSNADKLFKELLEKILGDTATPWRWENYVPYNYSGK